MIELYGIRGCDTMKKALAWLDEHGIAYRFHDYRRDGLDADRLRAWVAELGWEAMINRRGTTWRNLPAAVREQLDTEQAIALMLEQPALIRRPLLDTGTLRHLGFSATDYQRLLD
ncbi:MAG: ArsC family reductase [Sphingobacteriia bacterium]|nr:ArsC family reductase [Sphingobacteriia bacterium]NCC38459.1 ArsC family reductase [Gammaproteobacteria bacterium]